MARDLHKHIAYKWDRRPNRGVVSTQPHLDSYLISQPFSERIRQLREEAEHLYERICASAETLRETIRRVRETDKGRPDDTA